MERTGRDVDAFLADLDDDARPDMAALDEMISEVMVGHERELYEGRFWGGSDQVIIGYGRTDQRRSDGKTVEWFVAGIARQKRAISLYVAAVEDGTYLSERYGPDVGRVKVGKSVISFRSMDDIDIGALTRLVERARDVAAGED